MIKTIIDMLTQEGVSINRQQYVEKDNVFYAVGRPHRKAYVNTDRGRQDVVNELSQEAQNAIFAIWGDSATIDENIEVQRYDRFDIIRAVATAPIIKDPIISK